VSEQRSRDRHWRRTALLAAFSILIAVGAVVTVVATTEMLDAFGFLRFPLGFYLLAQGLLIGIVAVCFWSASAQERIDRAFSESEEF
jgi:putative solute:sodium symporter small subunit